MRNIINTTWIKKVQSTCFFYLKINTILFLGVPFFFVLRSGMQIVFIIVILIIIVVVVVVTVIVVVAQLLIHYLLLY